MKIDFKKWAQLALQVAEDKKGVEPLLLDLQNASDVADYIVIVTAESSAQLRAISDGIEDTLKGVGARLLRRDGRHGHRWLALDYGALVVHVLTAEARQFYRLEQLWEEAKEVPAKPVRKRVMAKHPPRPKPAPRRKGK